jgi:Predicted oxidoreductases of the aldo/keto reductase family
LGLTALAREETDVSDRIRDKQRRRFLKRAGLVGGLLGLGAAGAVLPKLLKYRTQLFLRANPPTLAPQPRAVWAGSTVKAYRPLGRTGWKMSDISFGGAYVRDPEVVRLAIDRGINYFDTSPDYSDNDSERTIGVGIKGHRNKVFIASKFCTTKGHLPVNASVPEIIAAVEATLGRLGTDYVDLLHIHACNSVDRLMAPSFHEAFDRLKDQGKARFLGVSSHTPELEKVMNHAVDSGRFDVIMTAYSSKSWPGLPKILERAHAKGIGVVAMKTLKGAYHSVLHDFSPTERTSFTQAAFKWVNANPNVSGLVVTIHRPAQIDEYLYASGEKISDDDLALLHRYDRLVDSRYCRPGCGECLDRCPFDIPINDWLRYAMYYEGYGAERRAILYYQESRRRVGHGAEVCSSCSAPCQDACPSGIPIRGELMRTDRLLQV